MEWRRVGMVFLVVLGAGLGVGAATRTTPLTVDHTCTDITRIPTDAILRAKEVLHIAYGHTSHGSQVTTGMDGLVAFADDGGKGLTHRPGMFAWNNGGQRRGPGPARLRDGR